MNIDHKDLYYNIKNEVYNIPKSNYRLFNGVYKITKSIQYLKIEMSQIIVYILKNKIYKILLQDEESHICQNSTQVRKLAWKRTLTSGRTSP